MTDNSIITLARRIISARATAFNTYPFFGRLLFHLGIGFSDCGTAYTDAEKIVFDPVFVKKLSDRELLFLLLHELLHVVLNHCTRGKEKNQQLYNLACDIVVNSCILDMFGEEKFSVAEKPVMHLAPDKTEGRNYSADEVYNMLIVMNEDEICSMYSLQTTDSHSEWEEISVSIAESLWNSRTKEVFGKKSSNALSPWLQRLVEEKTAPSPLDWRILLNSFLSFSDFDYSYLHPDKRFSDYDIIMPSFCENPDNPEADNIWFLVDTSGSITADELSVLYSEIGNAISSGIQLKGFISFFDTSVTAPISFESVSELKELIPTGGGGTSFYSIFESMDEHFPVQRPRAIIIMTDGYAPFPPEDIAQGIPVIWILTDTVRIPPWGERVYISF